MDALVAAAKEALTPLLQPLLPAHLVAAAEAAKAAAKAATTGGLSSLLNTSSSGPGGQSSAPEWPKVDARMLAAPLKSYEALVGAAEMQAQLEADARWGRASDENRWDSCFGHFLH